MPTNLPPLTVVPRLSDNRSSLHSSTSLATPNTIIPFFTSDAAIPAPIPELAPVTNATLPDQRQGLRHQTKSHA